MLKAIHEALMDYKFRDAITGETYYTADDILEIVESLGMLPPHVLGAKHWDEDNYWEPEE